MTNEAIEFVNKHLKSEDGERPKVVKPIQVVLPQKEMEKEIESEKEFEYYSSSEDYSESSPEEVIPRKKRVNRESVTSKRRRRSLVGETENRCPLVGALDPLTDAPIKTPMMDEGGYVMDMSSWEEFFKGEVALPFITIAQSESDLLEITKHNFNNIRNQIVNIPC